MFLFASMISILAKHYTDSVTGESLLSITMTARNTCVIKCNNTFSWHCRPPRRGCF